MSGLISQALQIRLDADPATAIRQRVAEHLSQIRIGGSDLLVGVWMPEVEAKSAGGIILPAQTRAEYQFQGVTGLILKVGPLAYGSEKTRHWFVDDAGDPDPPQVGEWVSFNFKQGEAFLLGTQPCRLISDQYVLLRLPRPDLVA